MVCTIKRRFAVFAATVVVVMPVAGSSTRRNTVRGTAGALAVISARARTDDHVLVRWERDQTIMINFHRFDLDSAVLSHVVKGLDAGKTECGARNFGCDCTVFFKDRSEKSVHI